MNISSFSPIRVTSFYQAPIVQDMNPQVKKILSVAALAFALLGACYLIVKRYFNVSIALKRKDDYSNVTTPIRPAARYPGTLPLFGTPQKCSFVKQVLCEEMFEKLPSNISELILYRCDLKDACRYFLYLPEDLEKISLRYCDSLSQESFELLPTKIRKIDLTGCTFITDEWIKVLCKKCPNLEIVILAGCLELTDVTATHLSTLQNLKSLSLARCQKITDEGIKNLPKTLIKLVLDECLTLYGLTLLSTGEELQELSLDRCLNLKIEEREIKQLLKRLTSISALECKEELVDIIVRNFAGENVSIQVGKTPQKKKKVHFNLGLF